ncbi:MAG: hypothetical protein DHS80DRAFT_27367 [Piptocephalis tieghemiana]|nr:MAG: hypothetical protein DHS80DRAFT_27367 [Piptocephalis tieghemiana]
MIRSTPSLLSGSFSLLVKNPRSLDFDNKRTHFSLAMKEDERRIYREEQVAAGRNGNRPPALGTDPPSPTLQLNIRRDHILTDSFHAFSRRNAKELRRGKLSIRFTGEEGVDAGGVGREWLSVLATQIFDPNNALFRPSPVDRVTYQPNPDSGINPDHLQFFTFVGRVIGKALRDGRLIDAHFTRSFYKHMLGKSISYHDVEAVDPDYYKSLVWLLENDITGVVDDMNFSAEVDHFGETNVVDLIPGGRDILVTEENKEQYVRLIVEHKLTRAIRDQIDAFLLGFHEMVPRRLVEIFDERELELLISGLPEVDIDDWRAHTEYQAGYTASSPQVQWFWRAVRSFGPEERAKLLQFSTGTAKVPLQGFAGLEGSNGQQKFQIQRNPGRPDRLPTAHTCFNQLDIPEYESYEQLRTFLVYAIQECSTGFGFG